MKPSEYFSHRRLHGIPPSLATTRRVLRVAGIGGIAMILLLSLLPADVQAPLRTRFLPELEHFIAYAAVAFCLRGGFPGRKASFWIAAALTAVAALLEIFQGLVPGRGPALTDALSSAAGAWFGCWLGGLLDRFTLRQRGP
jgi:VanZ family protein